MDAEMSTYTLHHVTAETLPDCSASQTSSYRLTTPLETPAHRGQRYIRLLGLHYGQLWTLPDVLYLASLTLRSNTWCWVSPL